MAILPIDSGRYGTPEMRKIFEEQNKIDCQLSIEAAVALGQASIGMIPEEAAAEISGAATSGRISARMVARIEAKRDHDTAALVEALSGLCTQDAKPWVHYGLTSSDLVDTCNSLLMRDALDVMEPKIAELATVLADAASRYAGLPAVGRTHGQHASIISFGLKFANWAAEMAAHIQRIGDMRKRILICKTLGVVGTGSLMGPKAPDVQRLVSETLGLHPAQVATQVVPRERYAEYVFGLALVASTLEKIAVEIRNLQRTEIGEVAESFKEGQMGSSAVPVKRNPIKSERVTSLARLVKSQVWASLENVPLWHERDLSNSANERFVIPTTSILVDEMLGTMLKVVSNLRVNQARIAANLRATGGQIFAEFVLEAMVRKGVPRLEAYRDVQRVAFEAAGAEVSYMDAVGADAAFSSILTPGEIGAIFVPEKHLGASAAIIRNVQRMVRRTAGRVAARRPSDS